MTSSRLAARLLVPIAAATLVSACATVPGQNRLAERDPLEKFNRGVWGVNMAADKVVIKPVTKVYRAVAPPPVRQGVSNFFENLSEPWSLVNNLLQGKPKRAADNLRRFAINTTLGVGGLFDRASKMGVKEADEDFGQTLAVWGINGGPYLVLPLLGPSTLRDGVGTGVAAYADPVRVGINNSGVDVWYKRGYLAAQIISGRSDLTESGGDAFLQSSLDPYAAARSAFLQRREAAILNHDGGEAPGENAAAGDSVPAAAGDAAPTPGAPLPESAAPMPGDTPPPAASAPQAPGAPLPASSAPLPGDAPQI